MNRKSSSLTKFRGIAGAVALVLWILVAPGLAEEGEIRVEASAEEIFVGESVDYHVEIRNVKSTSPPDLSDFKPDFDIVSLGDQSGNQSSTFIINGRVTQQNVLSHVYHFRLTPKSVGDLTIPPAKATIDGHTISSNRLPLRVQMAEKQDLVQVEIKVNHQRVYVTQPFTVTLRVLVHPLPSSSNTDPLAPLRRRHPHLQINWVDTPSGLAVDEQTHWLQPFLAEDGIGFTLNNIGSNSFFDGPRLAVLKLGKGREKRDGLDGKPIEYFVYELSRTFTPEKTGTYQFGPAVVKGTFVAGAEGNDYSAKRVVAISPSISVDVREVPSPRPPTFCGGIGSYVVSASATPTQLRVGDPLTLTLELQRGEQSGSLDLISAPDLSAVPGVADNFDLIDKNPTGRVEGKVKKFAYAMRPKHANVEIPALAITLFDPQAEKFTDISTAIIPLQVSEATKITSGDLVGSLPASGSTEIKSRAEGIFQNITDPSEVRDERVRPGNWVLAVIGMWCLAGIVIVMTTRYRRKSSDAGWRRRQQARRSALRQLDLAREALSRGHVEETGQHVRSALVGLIADMHNGVAEGLTAADAATALAAAGVPTNDLNVAVHLLESIEAAAYGAGQSFNGAQAIETATGLIGRIAPFLERGI